MIKVSQSLLGSLDSELEDLGDMYDLDIQKLDPKQINELLNLFKSQDIQSPEEQIETTYVPVSDTSISSDASKKLVADKGFQPPVKGSLKISGNFSLSPTDARHPKGHLGIDIRAPAGTAIYPMAPGIVTSVGDTPISGINVSIDHANGIKSYYAHCSTVNVRKGDQVGYDTHIATIGNTGNAKNTYPHLHFQVSRNGKVENPETYFSVPRYTPLDKDEKFWLSEEAKNKIKEFNLKQHLGKKSSYHINDIYKMSHLYYQLSNIKY